MENGNLKDNYFTTRSDCKGCHIKQICIGKSHKKRINITAHREEHERNIERIKSRRGHYMKANVKAPWNLFFGTLKEFLGLRKVNTTGIRQANKCMHLAAIAYNLKKYLKFTTRKARAGANALQKEQSCPYTTNPV